MAIRAEVSWRNSARWLQHKPSELSTPAEIRGLDRFFIKVREIKRDVLKECRCARAICAADRASLCEAGVQAKRKRKIHTVSPVRGN